MGRRGVVRLRLEAHRGAYRHVVFFCYFDGYDIAM